MEYKGHAAGPIDFDPDDKTFSGTVAGLRDVIHFEGRTATELERAFRDSPVLPSVVRVPRNIFENRNRLQDSCP